MNEDLTYLPVPYSDLQYSLPEPGTLGYDTGYYPHHSADPANIDSLTFDFDTLYTLRNMSMPDINLRQLHNRPLHVDTQLTTYDSEGSTASSTSLSVLTTPLLQIYSDPHPFIGITSPQSAPAEGGSMWDFETMPPLSASLVTHHSLPFGEDCKFDPLTLPLELEEVTQVPPHITEWKRVVELVRTNDFVPQRIYQPHTEADRQRYIRDVTLQETIFFRSDGSSEFGVCLDDALRQKLKHLKDKDDRMFTGCGPSVSIRIEWPGYPPWSKQIPTMDFKNPKGPITRAKLAKNIATCVRRFTKFVQTKPMEAESDRRWKIGEHHIKVEDLILVSLHHVSKGSWQPQLRFRSPPGFSRRSHQPAFTL